MRLIVDNYRSRWIRFRDSDVSMIARDIHAFLRSDSRVNLISRSLARVSIQRVRANVFVLGYASGAAASLRICRATLLITYFLTYIHTIREPNQKRNDSYQGRAQFSQRNLSMIIHNIANIDSRSFLLSFLFSCSRYLTVRIHWKKFRLGAYRS